MTDNLERLQDWYSSQCNGDWEHGYGVSLETLDNPGWRLKSNLRGTKADAQSIDRTKVDRNENDWIHYWIEKKTFHAACGPKNLSEMIGLFLDWHDNL